MKNISKLFLSAGFMLLTVTTTSGKKEIYSLGGSIKNINDCATRDTSDVVLGNMQLIFLPYDNDGRMVNPHKNWEQKNRDFGLFDILPSVWSGYEGLIFEGSRRIDGMKYEILDAGGASVQEGTLTIMPGMKQTVSLTYLPFGSYLLILTVGEESVAADFER